MSSLVTIFNAWPSAAALAHDIGVPDVTVRQWRNRSGSIPPRYWERIQRAALSNGHSLPIELFAPVGVIGQGGAPSNEGAKVGDDSAA
jgi:hypothetical protein